jgi:hypothetical protein
MQLMRWLLVRLAALPALHTRQRRYSTNTNNGEDGSNFVWVEVYLQRQKILSSCFKQKNKSFSHTFLGASGEKSANAAPQRVNRFFHLFCSQLLISKSLIVPLQQIFSFA